MEQSAISGLGRAERISTVEADHRPEEKKRQLTIASGESAPGTIFLSHPRPGERAMAHQANRPRASSSTGGDERPSSISPVSR